MVNEQSNMTAEEQRQTDFSRTDETRQSGCGEPSIWY